VVYPDGDYVGMSGRPYHPQGFCQHGDKQGIVVGPHLGKRIKFNSLPYDCKRVVRRDMQSYEKE
jgi:hypothetical protein